MDPDLVTRLARAGGILHGVLILTGLYWWHYPLRLRILERMERHGPARWQKVIISPVFSLLFLGLLVGMCNPPIGLLESGNPEIAVRKIWFQSVFLGCFLGAFLAKLHMKKSGVSERLQTHAEEEERRLRDERSLEEKKRQSRA